MFCLLYYLKCLGCCVHQVGCLFECVQQFEAIFENTHLLCDIFSSSYSFRVVISDIDRSARGLHHINMDDAGMESAATDMAFAWRVLARRKRKGATVIPANDLADLLATLARRACRGCKCLARLVRVCLSMYMTSVWRGSVYMADIEIIFHYRPWAVTTIKWILRTVPNNNDIASKIVVTCEINLRKRNR